MRTPSLLLATGIAVLTLQPAIGQTAHTTRIETRPVYGAIVTIEHGVRVFRPVPPTTHLIVNPGGKAPLLLGVGSQTILNQSAAAIVVDR